MRVRALILASLLTVLGSSAVAWPKIGLFADSTCTSCNLTVPFQGLATFYVRISTAGIPEGELFTSAELRVEGVPDGWVAIARPARAAILSLGDPMGDGADIAFSFTQEGGCIDLYTVTLVSGREVSDVVLRVTHKVSPSNPSFVCPLISVFCPGAPCDILLCVDGGALFVNSSSTCDVAVEPATWSAVKSLYRD